MGLAHAWRKERGLESEQEPDDDKRSAGSVKPHQLDGIPPSKKKGKRREQAGAVVSDRISKLISENEPEEESVSFGDALVRLTDGLRQRVTFRRPVMVKAWVKSAKRRQEFDKLPNVHVWAGRRGIVKMVMVDGRALVKLEGEGEEVLAFVGKDCKIYGRWYRFIDWVKGLFCRS